MADTTHGQPDSTLGALTDQCVMCGLCLPHCPTYRLDRHEAESPRGRIALARQLASGILQPSALAVRHLDSCLGCLSCEPVCPSQVRYGEILVQTRALLKPLRPPRSRVRRWLSDPAILVGLARIGSVLRADRWMPALASLLPGKGLLRRLLVELPAAPARLQASQPAPPAAGTRGRITLFTGCVASVFDRDTLDGARILLAALGYDVAEPRQTVCCGALALHAGDAQAAACTARSTQAALEACDSKTVLVSASGCLGSLRDHGEPGSTLAIEDILDFIAADERVDSLRFRALPVRAALHLPCTQMNVAGGDKSLRRLLAQVPGLQLQSLPSQPRCCGAAGSHFIEQPEHADRLRAEKLDQIQAQTPELLLTTNIGCRIFLGNGLRQRDSDISTLHPLALLARQLETSKP
jgi:glycolate oxidase iron-sulfur subunit